MATCNILAQTCVEIIRFILDGYSEGRNIFDRYNQYSFKAQHVAREQVVLIQSKVSLLTQQTSNVSPTNLGKELMQ